MRQCDRRVGSRTATHCENRGDLTQGEVEVGLQRIEGDGLAFRVRLPGHPAVEAGGKARLVVVLGVDRR